MTRLDPAPDRRRERIVGGIVVLVGVAVLVLSIFALLAAGSGNSSDVTGPVVTLPGGSGTAKPTASASTSASSSASASGSGTPTTSSASSSAPSGAGTQPLVVLNNTAQGGLAQQAASTFTQGGWTVTSTGNWSQSTLSTCAYYDPSVAGAQAAAEAFARQFPAIKRTAAKYDALPAGPVVVVLTSDYTG